MAKALKKESVKKTYTATLEDCELLSKFVTDFSGNDDILFIEIEPDGKILAKFTDSNKSILRYNQLDDIIFEFKEQPDMRIGVGLFNLKRISSLLSLISKEKNITFEFQVSTSKIEKCNDTYETDVIIIRTENFKYLKLPTANSTLINYVNDTVISDLMNSEDYPVVLKFDEDIIKKLKGISGLDETLQYVKITAKKGNTEVDFNFQGDYNLVFNSKDNVITEDYAGTLTIDFVKKMRLTESLISLDPDKVVISTESDKVIMAFSLVEDVND